MGSILMFILVFFMVGALWMVVFSSSLYFEGVNLDNSFISEPLIVSKQSINLKW